MRLQCTVQNRTKALLSDEHRDGPGRNGADFVTLHLDKSQGGTSSGPWLVGRWVERGRGGGGEVPAGTLQDGWNRPVCTLSWSQQIPRQTNPSHSSREPAPPRPAPRTMLYTDKYVSFRSPLSEEGKERGEELTVDICRAHSAAPRR